MLGVLLCVLTFSLPQGIAKNPRNPASEAVFHNLEPKGRQLVRYHQSLENAARKEEQVYLEVWDYGTYLSFHLRADLTDGSAAEFGLNDETPTEKFLNELEVRGLYRNLTARPAQHQGTTESAPKEEPETSTESLRQDLADSTIRSIESKPFILPLEGIEPLHVWVRWQFAGEIFEDRGGGLCIHEDARLVGQANMEWMDLTLQAFAFEGERGIQVRLRMENTHAQHLFWSPQRTYAHSHHYILKAPPFDASFGAGGGGGRYSTRCGSGKQKAKPPSVATLRNWAYPLGSIRRETVDFSHHKVGQEFTGFSNWSINFQVVKPSRNAPPIVPYSWPRQSLRVDWHAETGFKIGVVAAKKKAEETH